MEKTLVVANWKEYKNISEAKRWVEVFGKRVNKGINIVVCPSFVLIPPLHSSFIIHNSSFSLGAQDVSKFEEGPYTGGVSARQLADFVSYVIVGHSERRRHFGETDEDVRLKIEQCFGYELTPIVCVSNLEQVSRYQSVKVSGEIIFAFEPLFAVGSGQPDTPENAQDFAKKVGRQILYGGSVNSENVKSFVDQPDIRGVLVGQASLDPAEFARICYEVR